MWLQLHHDYERFIEVADLRALTDHLRYLQVGSDGMQRAVMN
jgi:hypothetical protein